MDYYEILNRFISEFVREFGERKFDEINDKIENSNKIKTLIRLAKEKKLAPLAGDIVPSILEIPSFMFSNNMKVALASFLAFERWNKECNKNGEYLSNSEMCVVLRQIFTNCGRML